MSQKQKNTRNIKNPYPTGSPAARIWNDNPDVRRGSSGPNRGRKFIGAVALVGTVAGGLFLAGKATEGSSPEARAKKIETGLVENIKNQELPVSKDIIVLNEGAKVRETPARFVRNPDSMKKDMDVPNVVYEVPADTHVVIKQGLEWEDEDGETWLGFEFTGPNEEKSRLRWVNKTALIAEAATDTTETSNRLEPPISVYGYDTDQPRVEGYTATIDDSGEVVRLDAQYGQIAQGTTVRNEQLIGMLDQIGAATQ